jgi:heme transport system ATP-binding protein
VIEARNVVVRVGRVTLLDRVDVDVRGGEIVALFGPNGAGKSTLLATLAGDRPPASGTVRLDGRDITTLSALELATRRAVLRQRSSLTAAFTALEVVRLGQPRADDAIARRCLAAVEMEGFAGRRYPSLSGGEQQRVQLARILAQIEGRAAAALLLDEPAAALDLRQQRLIEQIGRRAASRGHAVVVVTHDLDLVARHADRVVVLRAGVVLADGPPAAVLTAALVSRAFDTPVDLERTPGGALVVRPASEAPDRRSGPGSHPALLVGPAA